jgi:hypothetical protein
MQAAEFNVVFITLLSIIVVLTICRLFDWKSGKNELALVSLVFIPSPIYVGDSVHKMIFIGDIVSILILFSLLFKKSQNNFYIKNFNKAHLFFALFLVAIPFISTLMGLLFGVRDSYIHLFATIIRSFFGLLLMAYVFLLVEEKKILPSEVALTGGIGFFLFLMGVFASYNGLLESDILRYLGTTDGFHEWNQGLGGGSMGMYRGEIGGISAVVVAFVVPYLLRINSLFKFSLGLCLLLFSIIAAAYVGSRQGLVGILIGCLVAIAAVLISSKGKDYIFFISTAIVFMLLIAGLGYFISDNPDLYDWVLIRFESLFNKEAAVSLAYRDDRSLIIIDHILSNPFNYLLGVGYAEVLGSYNGEDWVLFYVDSDILWMLQQVGVIGLICYIYFFYLNFKNAIISHCDPEDFASYIAVMCVLLFYLYGHFVFSNLQASHISAVYLNIVLLSLFLNGYRPVASIK